MVNGNYQCFEISCNCRGKSSEFAEGGIGVIVSVAGGVGAIIALAAIANSA